MHFNILLGFLFPWLLGFYLYLKDKKTVLSIAPFSSLVAHLFNMLGMHLGLWQVTPFHLFDVSVLPFELGLYAILGSLLVYTIQRTKLNHHLIILIFGASTTLLEQLSFFLGIVHYSNSWNIWWTFISYLTPYYLVYSYYIALKHVSILLCKPPNNSQHH
ncbi:hypothetical protein HNQ80_000822 [Anaerosolibacter carboniphilus]|uniref:Uncharacterized protein n=1 Tax=Anaerosolibacter carboniphilus TaxID=1417629 RepID=A0A841KX28_9FIRM|nr:CBO0543 family protein [Anaerosolibacter carboniphilus]MBB6214739.1 hypothetical protein [Anaerosolibacter carboniphilus]